MALDVGELVARIRLDGLREFENDQRRAETSFRDLGRQADRSTSGLGQGFQDARRDVTQLADSTSRSGTSMRADLQRTEQTGRQSANTIGNAFRDSMRSAGDGMRSELDNVTSHAGAAGSEGGGGFAAAFGGRVAALGSKAGPIAAALVGVTAIGVVAGKSLADAVNQGFELKRDRDFSAAKFGLNPAQMEQAGRAAGEAYGNNFGESVQANINATGIAMQAGIIKPGASAAEIQPVIEKLSMVSELMGTEIPETARAAGQMIKTGLVKDGAGAFDLLTAAQQKGLNISDDLLDTMNEYGTQYRKLGLDGETALGTISQMMQGGARDADLAADALKEFGIRVVDGSETTKDAYTSLGLNVEETAAAFGKGGQAAATMSDTVIDKLRNIQDPVERNRIGVELFGTQWEDLGGAINNMDLSNAGGELGEVSNAAQRAADQMSGVNNSFESAKRKISKSADDVKLKLAEAFAPSAIGLSNWIGAHENQITDFFKAAADGALIFSQGLLQVGAFGTDMVATMLDAGASILDYFVIPLMNGVEQVGSVMSHLPGAAGKLGEKLRDNAKDAHDSLGTTRDSLRGMADGYTAAGDGMRSFSDHIQGARENLMGLNEVHKGTQANTKTTAEFVGGLTAELNKLPRNVPINVATPGGNEARQLLQTLGIQTHTDNNKNIVVDAPLAPAVLEQLRALGIAVRTDNGKTILVTDNGTAKLTGDVIDDIAKKRRTAYIQVQELQGNTQSAFTAPNGIRAEQGPGLYALPTEKASGGRVGGNGGPRADDQLIWASSPEWVIQSEAAEHYGPAAMNAVNNGTAHIMAFANGGQVGQPAAYGLPAGSTGGFPSWVTELGAQYGVKPSTYAGHQEGSRSEAGYAPNPQGLNRGIDWGGSTAQMQTFAEAMYARAQSDPAIEQIIWQNPQTGQKIGWHGRSPDTDGSYFASDYAGHTDHVHLRVAAQLGAAAAGGTLGVAGPRTIPIIKNPDGTYTSSDPAWAALINRESGGNASIVQGVNDVNSGGNEASGLFQIAKGTWAANGGAEFAATAGEADPEKQAIVAARIFDKSGGNPWGAGLAGREDEAGLRAGITTDVAADPAAATSAAASGVQNVFVTGGRLDGAASGTDTSTPSTPSKPTPDATKVTGIGPLPLRAYAQGGFGPAPDEATMLSSARSWMTLAGEAGPEAFIPIDRSPRSMALWMETGRRLGAVKAYAQGGFGGYTKDTTDAMKPKNAYDWLALGVGGAFAAESLIEPYIGMATGKQITLGDLSPTVNTGANSSGAAESAVNQFGTDVTRQIDELIKAVKDGKVIQIVQPRSGIEDRWLRGAMGARGM